MKSIWAEWVLSTYTEQAILAMASPDFSGDMQSIWHARLAHADRNLMKKTAQSGAVLSMKVAKVCSTNNYWAYVEATMKNMPMCSQTSLESRPATVWHTDVAELNVPSVGEAKYFVTFINEVSRYVNTSHIKAKSEAWKLLKRHVRWFERQMDRQVRKLVLDGG